MTWIKKYLGEVISFCAAEVLNELSSFTNLSNCQLSNTLHSSLLEIILNYNILSEFTPYMEVNMENRWSARTPLSVKVTLYHQRIPVAICTANNIGLGGVFVTTGPLTFPRNTLLDVEFKPDGRSKLSGYRMSTCVAHIANDGLGLAFMESDLEFKRKIRRMLLDGALNHMPKDPLEELGLKSTTGM